MKIISSLLFVALCTTTLWSMETAQRIARNKKTRHKAAIEHTLKKIDFWNKAKAILFMGLIVGAAAHQQPTSFKYSNKHPGIKALAKSAQNGQVCFYDANTTNQNWPGVKLEYPINLIFRPEYPDNWREIGHNRDYWVDSVFLPEYSDDCPVPLTGGKFRSGIIDYFDGQINSFCNIFHKFNRKFFEEFPEGYCPEIAKLPQECHEPISASKVDGVWIKELSQNSFVYVPLDPATKNEMGDYFILPFMKQLEKIFAHHVGPLPLKQNLRLFTYIRYKHCTYARSWENCPYDETIYFIFKKSHPSYEKLCEQSPYIPKEFINNEIDAPVQIGIVECAP